MTQQEQQPKVNDPEIVELLNLDEQNTNIAEQNVELNIENDAIRMLIQLLEKLEQI